MLVERRWPDGVHDATARTMLGILNCWRIESGGDLRILAAQIGTYGIPVFALIGRAEHTLVPEVQRMCTRLAKHERQRPSDAMQIGIGQHRCDTLRLPGPQVELVHTPAEDDLRIVQIRRDV